MRHMGSRDERDLVEYRAAVAQAEPVVKRLLAAITQQQGDAAEMEAAALAARRAVDRLWEAAVHSNESK